MDRASQAEERGCVHGFDNEVIADALGYEVEEVERIISVLADKGVIASGRLAAWDKYQPKREDGSAERAKAYRERVKGDANATERNRTQTTAREEEIREEKKERVVALCAPPAPKATNKMGRNTRLAAGWEISEGQLEYALSSDLTLGEAHDESLKFKDYHLSKGSMMTDWDAAWRTWVRNHLRFRSTDKRRA
jgi:hypothetical protein